MWSASKKLLIHPLFTTTICRLKFFEGDCVPFEGFSLGSIFPSDVLRGNEQSLNTQKKPRKIKVFDFFFSILFSLYLQRRWTGGNLIKVISFRVQARESSILRLLRNHRKKSNFLHSLFCIMLFWWMIESKCLVKDAVLSFALNLLLKKVIWKMYFCK